MKVLFVSAEAFPFAKVGGLADVVGSLPPALKRQGVDARVLMPAYGFINHDQFALKLAFTFQFAHRNGTSDVRIYETMHDGIPVYMLQGWPFFGEESSVYTTWDWDVPRFLWFNQAAMAFMWELYGREGWRADVVNVHDWHTALLPFLLVSNRHDPFWQKTASVLTIHNIAYQGEHVGGFLWQAGIAARDHHLLSFHGLQDNLLGIAIAYSDMLNTVSPRYATEIQYPYAGYGLAGIVRDRQQDLVGILNGIDTERWNPATDPQLVRNFDVNNVASERIVNKQHLQSYLGLKVSERTPLIGMVTRLASQKGMDIALPALRRLLLDTDVHFVLLGTGEPEIENAVRRLANDFHWRVRAILSYDGMIAQRIYGGSDMFLMPSHFEPCGIGQMMAMRYGALPVVRETGGLADTVINYDNSPDGRHGTGFVFQWQTSEAVLGTLRWAIDTYHKRPQAWAALQVRAMQQDFSWRKSAQAYIDLYNKAIAKRGA